MVVAEDDDDQRDDIHTNKHCDYVEPVREILIHVAVRATALPHEFSSHMMPSQNFQTN